MSSSNGIAPKPLKIFMHSMDGQGHLNACIGLSQALAKRGHRVIFLLNSVFAGKFAKFGFEEILLSRNVSESVNPVPDDPVKGFATQLLKSGFLSGKSSLEKLKSINPADKKDNFVQTLYDSTVDFNPQIESAINREKPDCFILDHFLAPPVILQNPHFPYMTLYSGNPLALYQSEKLPPFGSGYPTNSDPSTWKEFREVQKTHFFNTFIEYQNDLNKMFNYQPETDEVHPFTVQSKYLNIYQYPEELDYHDVEAIGNLFARVDAFLREVPEPFQLPAEFVRQPGDKLIYVSLGSMGSIDVKLMKRIVEVLNKTPHKCIVSKGPLHAEYDLPSRKFWGQAFLPQTQILPLVDLVITHGGNNTVTETFSFGKPMIVMPLFGDQYDNAQRVHEKGYGIRLEPYSFTESELLGAIDKLLNDTELHQRLETAVRRIATSDSKAKVCQRIEEVVARFKADQCT